jgi:hypothetical protein
VIKNDAWSLRRNAAELRERANGAKVSRAQRVRFLARAEELEVKARKLEGKS